MNIIDYGLQCYKDNKIVAKLKERSDEYKLAHSLEKDNVSATIRSLTNNPAMQTLFSEQIAQMRTIASQKIHGLKHAEPISLQSFGIIDEEGIRLIVPIEYTQKLSYDGLVEVLFKSMVAGLSALGDPELTNHQGILHGRVKRKRGSNDAEAIELFRYNDPILRETNISIVPTFTFGPLYEATKALPVKHVRQSGGTREEKLAAVRKTIIDAGESGISPKNISQLTGYEKGETRYLLGLLKEVDEVDETGNTAAKRYFMKKKEGNEVPAALVQTPQYTPSGNGSPPAESNNGIQKSVTVRDAAGDSDIDWGARAQSSGVVEPDIARVLGLYRDTRSLTDKELGTYGQAFKLAKNQGYLHRNGDGWELSQKGRTTLNLLSI